MILIIECPCSKIIEKRHVEGSDGTKFVVGLCEHCGSPNPETGYIGDYASSPNWVERKPKPPERFMPGVEPLKPQGAQVKTPKKRKRKRKRKRR